MGEPIEGGQPVAAELLLGRPGGRDLRDQVGQLQRVPVLRPGAGAGQHGVDGRAHQFVGLGIRTGPRPCGHDLDQGGPQVVATAGLLGGDCGDLGEIGQQLDVVGGEGVAAGLVEHFEHPEDRLAVAQRHAEDALGDVPDAAADVGGEAGVLLRGRDGDRLPGGRDRPGDADPDRNLELDYLLGLRADGDGELQLLAAVVEEEQRRGPGADDPRGGAHDQGQQVGPLFARQERVGRRHGRQQPPQRLAELSVGLGGHLGASRFLRHRPTPRGCARRHARASAARRLRPGRCRPCGG